MARDGHRRGKSRRVYVRAAWASPLTAALVLAAVWAVNSNHQGTRGERPLGVLLLYLTLLVVSALAGLAGLCSLVGIRSWRDALVIVPGALLGVCVSGYTALMCYLSYALMGRNLGG